MGAIVDCPWPPVPDFALAYLNMNTVTLRLAREDAVLVTVQATEGSVPREVGAWMLVFAHDETGTIGGGQLEFNAIAQARRLLASPGAAPEQLRQALGPSLGQCCGGVVQLALARVGAGDANALARQLRPQRAPLALFGGGHVGKALVAALSPLPFAVHWIDSRDEIFPAHLPPQVQCEHSDPVHAAVPHLATRSRVLIMSFSHAQDLDIVAACLLRLRERQDLPYVGLIGSKTKWASFRHRLQARGFTDVELNQVTCPIGIPGISGKEPEVIAASVAAQILQLAPPGKP